MRRFRLATIILAACALVGLVVPLVARGVLGLAPDHVGFPFPVWTWKTTLFVDGDDVVAGVESSFDPMNLALDLAIWTALALVGSRLFVRGAK